MLTLSDSGKTTSSFEIPCSIFNIQYFFRKHGKSIILELPIAEGSAEQLLQPMPVSFFVRLSQLTALGRSFG
jgi:hypothetical protein